MVTQEEFYEEKFCLKIGIMVIGSVLGVGLGIGIVYIYENYNNTHTLD